MFPISLCCFEEKQTQIRLNKLLFSLVQPSDVRPPWHKGGRGVLEPLRQVFFTCCSTLKRFFLQWKAFDPLVKTRYMLWVLALLKACDVTKRGRHLGFYQELEIG